MSICRTSLRVNTQVLRRRTSVRLQNDPDEVYAARSGDAYPYSIDVLRNHNVVEYPRRWYKGQG